MKPCKAVRWLVLSVLVSFASSGAFAQAHKSTHWGIPQVYNVQNTGKWFPAPVFPDLGHLPIIRPLPDPFRFVYGNRDTSFWSWEHRRNEIMAAIEKYEIGPVPDGSDCTITAHYTPPASGSDVGTLTVQVTRNSNGKSLTLTSGVYIPQGMGPGPFPALIPMEIDSFSFGSSTFHFPPPTPPDYGSLPPSVFQGLPIATVGFVSTQLAGLTFGQMDHSADPFYQLYPELKAGIVASGTSNSGTYAAWTWGVNRLLDGMEIATHQSVDPLPIDMKHLAVTGCSFAGKMALFAGAFDERIALTIAQESGGGGAPSWRVSHEIEPDGSVEDIHDTSYDWFGRQMYDFAENNSYKIPEDHDELMAMVAPRALLETGNTDFYWLSNRSNYVSARATQRIYNTLGIGDRFGFYIDGGHAHCGTLPAEAPAIAAYVDKFLLGDGSANTDVEVNPYPKLDYQRWTWWWGKEHPRFPDNWNPGDSTMVMSLDNPHSDGHGVGLIHAGDHGIGRPLFVKAGETVLGGYDLSLADGHAAANAMLAGATVQMDISSRDGTSYTVSVPLPDQGYSIAANDDSWLPSADQKSPLVYQGSATAGAAGVVTDAYLSVLGEVPAGSGAGTPGGPGLATDTGDPVNVRFHINDSDHDGTGKWSPTETVHDSTP